MAEKLVRNNVPKVVPGRKFRTADDSEKLELLRQKLLEEVEEFLEDNAMDELADILDVVMALAEEVGTIDSLYEFSDKKYEWLGGFSENVVYIRDED